MPEKRAGIGGLEWMEGIPGEVGGALRMNAGAMGAQTFDNVVRVRFLDAEGNAHDEKRRGDWKSITGTCRRWKRIMRSRRFFRDDSRRAEEIARKLDESQEKRRTTQPAAKSAGCIFKNPSTIPAGKLVDELGLKNCAVGKARVSEVHGNFIVNDGGATAAEMLELIEKIKTDAREKARDRIGNRSANRGGGRMNDERACRRNIAVLKGGPGSEREVSLATGARRGQSFALVRRGSDEVDVRGDRISNCLTRLSSRSSRCTELSAKTDRCSRFSKIAASPTPAKASKEAHRVRQDSFERKLSTRHGVPTPDVGNDHARAAADDAAALS